MIDRWPTKRVDVPYGHVMDVVRALPDLLPPGSRIGFNFEEDRSRAWIVVDAEVDADPLVASILDRYGASGG